MPINCGVSLFRIPEFHRFLKGRLDAERTDELATMMRKAGLLI
ncbi:MAG: hypothetical protein OXE82_08575 [Rhodobacter sp.]|nr:hypothetical protein [Rhodobacter sp.]